VKFRVSMVESFRKWAVDQDAEDDALAELLANISGEGVASELMQAGTAFHKALETAPTGIDVSELGAEGYTFCITDSLEIGLTTIRELRASKTYVVDGQPITISGQVDQIEGKRIEDHKTTGRFDAERYMEGYQWRLYLDIFGADHFRWNVFEISAMDEPKCYQVFGQHRLEQYRYPGLEADCQALVERFARFVRERFQPSDRTATRPPRASLLLLPCATGFANRRPFFLNA
jgi:hypothetical protein